MPVVVNGVIYTFGAEAQLHAIDLASRHTPLEPRHHEALRCAQGVFWRGRVAARRKPGV